MVDTLSFFLPTDTSFGLSGPNSSGANTKFSFYRSGNSLYIVKGRTNRGLYEKYSWGPSYIRLVEDRTCGPGCSRQFIGLRRLKRQMPLNENLSSRHRMIQFDKTCNVVKDILRTTGAILELHKIMDHGGDVGQADTIVLRTILPQGGERFYYAKGWGWVKWESIREGQVLAWSVKNVMEPNPLAPDTTVSCVQPENPG